MCALYGGIEAGGTKFVCTVGTNPEDSEDVKRIPTTTPAETLRKVIDFFHGQKGLSAVGIASFGPLDLNRNSPTYGYITTTPKPGWAFTDLARAVGKALNVPVGFDTDVNAAGLGERQWGAARGLDNFIYLTIGTGIGGGGMINGKLIHGMVHPEMGHIRLPHDKKADPYRGYCPFHGDCFEGLASGPALQERWGQSAETLPADHPAWVLEAHYLALAVSDFVCTMSPQKVILGGGVMEQKQLFPMIRQDVQKLLNGYIKSDEILKDIENYIVPPELGKRAGVLGAIALAMQAHKGV
ncbi:MAG: ROK family protein [Dehalococcoidales bacterium]|nr:ROK family protein [Dehalococcoidales bacterium]